MKVNPNKRSVNPFPEAFHEPSRKVHLYQDQKGATYGGAIPGGQPRLYTNTACKGNFNHEGLLTTGDPSKVTCKLCRDKIDTPLHRQMYGRANRPVLGGKDAPLLLDFVLKGSTAPPKARYRRTWLGKLVLQIEVFADEREANGFKRWRDATLEDLGIGIV